MIKIYNTKLSAEQIEAVDFRTVEKVINNAELITDGDKNLASFAWVDSERDIEFYGFSVGTYIVCAKDISDIVLLHKALGRLLHNVARKGSAKTALKILSAYFAAETQIAKQEKEGGSSITDHLESVFRSALEKDIPDA